MRFRTQKHLLHTKGKLTYILCVCMHIYGSTLYIVPIMEEADK